MKSCRLVLCLWVFCLRGVDFGSKVAATSMSRLSDSLVQTDYNLVFFFLSVQICNDHKWNMNTRRKRNQSTMFTTLLDEVDGGTKQIPHAHFNDQCNPLKPLEPIAYSCYRLLATMVGYNDDSITFWTYVDGTCSSTLQLLALHLFLPGASTFRGITINKRNRFGSSAPLQTNF